MDWTKADAERLGKWLERGQTRILVAVRRLGISASDAEDILQDTLLGVLSHWNDIDSFDKFLAFSITRARWRALDALRRRAREGPLESELSQTERAEASQQPGAEGAESTVRRSEIMEAIERLPERSRQVMLLSVSGMNSIEIAEELGIEPASVRSLLRYARYLLASRIQETE